MLIGVVHAAGAQASTTMGPTLEGTTPTFAVVADTQTAGILIEGGASAAAPVSGVLVKIRMRRGASPADPGSYAYRIFNGTSPNLTARPATPSGANDVFLTVPVSTPAATETYLPADANGDRAGIPIAQGEFLGVWMQKQAFAFTDSPSGSQYVRLAGDVFNTQRAYSPFSGFRLLVAAVIEPDADADKYGDETQDECPSDAARHKAPCAADVALTMTAEPGTVTAGDNVTYAITVENKSGSPAGSVSVANALPAGAALVSASSTQGQCGSAATVTCAVGTLAAGAKAVATLVVRTSAAGTLQDTATVASAIDPNTANDSATATITVNAAPVSAPPDITPPVISAATATPAVVKAGKKVTVTYTLSEAAIAEIIIERARPGRRVGKACKAPSRANAKGKRCTRWARAARLTQGAVAGVNATSWPDVAKSSRPGRYRARLGATDAAGLKAAEQRLAFRVTKR